MSGCVRGTCVVEHPALARNALKHGAPGARSGSALEVEGPGASVAEAQLLIEQREPDVAIIDFRLNGETSEPVAKILAGKQIPFVFMSGLAQDDLPEALQVYQSVTKPIDSARLRSLLRALLSPGGD
jgi:DNA-binding NtrC family response regulator